MAYIIIIILIIVNGTFSLVTSLLQIPRRILCSFTSMLLKRKGFVQTCDNVVQQRE
jgi:hypothetical protein